MIDKNNNNESNLEREERWKTYQSKSCDYYLYNNRNKDNSPKTLTHQRKIGISSYD